MRYRTLVADPPWPIQWSGGTTTAGASTGSTRSYRKRPLPYTTMPVDEIAALPVGPLAADDAHLFLWTLDRYVLDGSAAMVARAWGFTVLPQMIVWRKANAGLGRYIRPTHELVVIARRGAARMNELSTVSVHDWAQPRLNGAKVHSAKPDGFLDLVEQLVPGPYVELFARRARFGWDYFGDESLGTAELEEAMSDG
jgi:N6-adenosine-specific RNA methylase IME4